MVLYGVKNAFGDFASKLCCLLIFLYGDQRLRSVDKLRYKMFMQKFEKEGKVLDLSLLPPCKANLQLHIMRANYVAF